MYLLHVFAVLPAMFYWCDILNLILLFLHNMQVWIHLLRNVVLDIQLAAGL